LGTNLAEFKKFHATRKFRAAAKAIIAVNKMSSLMASLKAASDEVNQENAEGEGGSSKKDGKEGEKESSTQPASKP
jgi:hypothetical protein